MCIGCWIEEGRAFEVTDKVKAAIPLMEQADPFGDLHIVVEDTNLKDSNIQWCRDEWCPKHNNLKSDIDLCNMLLDMSMGERWATWLLADDPSFDPAAAA